MPVRLGDVLAHAPTHLTVVVAPAGLEAPVRDVVVAHAEPGPGDVVMGAARADEVADLAVLRAAGRGGASAVVLPRERVHASLLLAAWQAGVALLAEDRSADGSVSELLSTVLDDCSQNARGGLGDDDDAQDLFEMCNLFARSVGAPVAVEDAELHVVAYSSGGSAGDEYRREAILQRRTTRASQDWLTSSGALAHLRGGGGALVLEGEDFLPGARRRMLAGVRLHGELLGVVWACADGHDFAPDAGELVDQLARRAAPVLARRQRSAAVRQEGETRWVASALDGGQTTTPPHWGLPPDAVLALAGVEPAGSGQVNSLRLAGMLRAQPALADGAATVSTIGSTVYVLTAVAGGGGRTRVGAREDLTGAVARVRDLLGVRLLVARAAPCPLAALPSAGREVRTVLRALRHPRAGTTTACLSDVAELVSLLELADVLDARPHLQSAALAQMRAHDVQHGTSYVETASALLDAFGDVPVAAAAVTVHPNSYRYRVRRLTELFGINLSDPDVRLLLHLQLRTDRLRQGAEPVPSTRARKRRTASSKASARS